MARCADSVPEDWNFGRMTRRLLGALICIYVCIAAIAMFFENHLIYFPPPTVGVDWSPTHLEFVEADFQSADGTKLHGWYFRHEAPRAIVLYCHGNADFVPNLGSFASFLRDEYQLSTFVWDYRGYGKSGGQPYEAGVLADAESAQQWLADYEGIAIGDIVLMGRSLGGAVAVHLASRRPAAALILDSTFSSLPRVAAYHYPYLPVRWLMRTRFDSEKKIRNYSGPVFQLHGDQDRVVPFEFGRELFDAIPGPKEFFVLNRGEHNGPRPDAFYEQALAFIERHR